MGNAAGTSIDIAHLDKYVCGDTALLDEILSIFVEQVESWRARLATDLDDDTWHFVCHALKGASRGVGAWALGDAAERGETLIGEARDERARAELSAEIERLVKEAVHCALAMRDKFAA